MRTRLTTSYLAMTLAIFVMAFLVVAQLRTSRATTSQVEIPTRNVYAMATLLRQEREARVRLESQVATLRGELESYQREGPKVSKLTEAMTRELETMRIALGLRAMRGPGLLVRLDDPSTQPKGANPVVVTYQDIVAVINELWAAGAEAIAVNGQRVTAITGLSQVGGTVVVNLQRLNGPFQIVAIGDPSTLERALNIRGGLIDGLRALGLSVTMTPRASIVVPAYRGTFNFEHAKPAQ